MNVRQIYLLTCAVGIVPIALTYGLFPQSSLGFLFGLQLPEPDGVHLFRAAFWFAGCRVQRLRQAAIWSAVVFMAGLAAGRMLSLLLDGPAHWLLDVYLGLELVFGTAGALLLGRRD